MFQLHGVNEFGKTVIKKQLRPDQMTEFFVNLPASMDMRDGIERLLPRVVRAFGAA